MYKVGDMLKSLRLQSNLSQEELCDGICTTSNLSKIENGIQTPSRSKFEALMQRLGQPTDRYPSFKSKLEFELHSLKIDIRYYLNIAKFDEVEEMLGLLKNYELESIDYQFILYAEALLPSNSHSTRLEKLKKALDITRKNFNHKEILRYLLTKDEIAIINSIAIANYRIGEVDMAIDIMTHLKNFLEAKIIDIEEKTNTYSIVLYNLSKWIGAEGDYKESLAICDLGIENSVKYMKMTVLAELLFNKGYCLLQLGQTSEASEAIKASYHILKIIKKHDVLKTVKHFMDENNIQP